MSKEELVAKRRPIKFYKYRSMDGESERRKVEQTICRSEVFFASASTLNDPFDLQPIFSLKASKATQIADYRRLLKKYEPHLGRNERRAGARRAQATALGIENIEQTLDVMQKVYAEFITNKIGVFCVSTKSDDILMWSHYGDSHRGICLEFDGLLPFMAHAQEVTYSKERVPINDYIDDNPVAMKKSLLIKADCWAYENEWRLIRDNPGPGIVEFRPPNLTGVIIGALGSPETIDHIEQWTKKSKSPIMIYQASVDRQKFSLNIQPKNKR